MSVTGELILNKEYDELIDKKFYISALKGIRDYKELPKLVTTFNNIEKKFKTSGHNFLEESIFTFDYKNIRVSYSINGEGHKYKPYAKEEIFFLYTEDGELLYHDSIKKLEYLMALRGIYTELVTFREYDDSLDVSFDTLEDWVLRKTKYTKKKITSYASQWDNGEYHMQELFKTGDDFDLYSKGFAIDSEITGSSEKIIVVYKKLNLGEIDEKY